MGWEVEPAVSDLGVHLIEPCSCECHVRAAVVELVETYATSLAAERARADRLEDALTDALRMALAALAAERAHADGLVEVLTRLQPLQQSRERRLIAVALVEHIRRREAES